MPPNSYSLILFLPYSIFPSNHHFFDWKCQWAGLNSSFNSTFISSSHCSNFPEFLKTALLFSISNALGFGSSLSLIQEPSSRNIHHHVSHILLYPSNCHQLLSLKTKSNQINFLLKDLCFTYPMSSSGSSLSFQASPSINLIPTFYLHSSCNEYFTYAMYPIQPDIPFLSNSFLLCQANCL